MSRPTDDGAAHLTLADLAAPMLVYVQSLTPSAAATTTSEVVQDYADEWLATFEQAGRRAGYDVTQVRAALFALVAWMDERLAPYWATWSALPLTTSHFHETEPGVEFYVRLEAARRGDTNRDTDVLEVFVLCLRLGFHGRYRGSARAEKQRRSLLEHVTNDVLTRRGRDHQTLTSDVLTQAPWTPPATPWWVRLPWWLVLATVLAVVVANGWLSYRLTVAAAALP